MFTKLNNLLKNKIFLANLFILEIISHVFYKVSFEDDLYRDFEINKIVFNQELDLYRTELESPFNTILVNLFNIESPDVYAFILYAIFQITLVLICINLDFLENYSTLFLFGGWLVSVSWFVGFVENISVLLIILCYKKYFHEKENFLFYFYLFLFGFNHFGMALFTIIVFLIFSNFRNFWKVLLTTAVSYTSLHFYLKYIVNFKGRDRFRFIFNQNTVDTGTEFISNNLITFFWSGFMGLIFILIFIIFNSELDEIYKYVFALAFAVFASAIVTDVSRIFTIICIPIILKLIDSFKSFEFEKNVYEKYLILLVVVSNFIIQERWIYGIVYQSSPNQSLESVYNFFARLVNSLMKNIWT